jgi:hypothetical protein
MGFKEPRGQIQSGAFAEAGYVGMSKTIALNNQR